MSNSFQTTGNDDLDAVIASFLQALERGDAPDRDDLIKERPQFEEELRAFFADLDGLPNVEGEEATEEFAAGNDSSRVIGNYELVQKIGSGGMGEVWVAKQSKPVKRRVALKLIKAGMDSKQVVSRFEVERQALAAIDHPNVAKVLDAGTTPLGQPFFVMELVNGAPLTKYCDEAKLSVQERLELMVQIASAVQHAHHKGIVHRDLKPANILVTVIDGKPVPKIIDFGLAKALGGRLTEESFATHFGSVMGTLEYMAPEQAGYSGQDVDTRADIYSLGVILYELLTGLLPFDSSRLRQAALDEMMRIIREEEPARPSLRFSSSESAPSYAAVRRSEPKQLAGLLRSELDWIVMKSLDKDRNRRYETASSFSQDISRYLIGDAVHAHPPTLVYRLRKYAVKNRQLFVFFASIFTVLVASTAVSAWFGFAAIRSRDDAIEAGKIANEKRREATLAGNRAAEEADRAKKLAAVAERSSNASLFALGMAQAAQGRVKEAIDSFDSVDPSYRNVEWQLGQQLVGGSARTWNLRQPFQISGDAELLVRQTDQKAMVSSLKEGKQTSIFSINGNVSRLSNDGSCLLTTEKTTDDAKIVFHSYYVNDGSKLCTIGPIEESWKFEVTNRYILFTCREHPEILRIHDVVDGRELKVLEFDEDVEQIVCNELRIALLVGNTVELLDAEDLAETRSIEPDDDSYFGRIAMTRDGALLCAGSNDALEIFSLGSKVSRMKTLHKKPGSADVLEFSPDGSYVAVVNGGYSKVGSDPDPQIEVIERESERSRFFSGHVGISIDALWFADEDLQFLTLGEDGLLKLWNERSPVVEFAVRADDELTRAVTFSPDSTRLLSGGSNCTVVCWDARSGSKMWELDAGREVIDVAWLPNSRSCLAATDQRLLHLDASTGTVLECILDLSEAASTITCLSTSSKREYAAIGLSDGMVEIWKTNPLRKIADKPFDGRIQCLELNEQKKLAYVSYFPMPEGFQRAEQLAKSGTACWQWDPSLKEMSWVRSWGCKSISVDPVTSVVACGSARGQINTLDFLARENKELSSTFGNRNSSVSWTSGPNEQSRKVSGPTLRFTNDGSRLVASGNGGRLVVYDHVASRELFVTNVSDASTLSGWSTHLNDIDISDDGQRIAIAAGDFHTVKIINLDSSWKSVGLPRWEAVSSE